MENEDDDPVGCPPLRDPLTEFRKAAADAGLIFSGDPLDKRMAEFAFAFAIVERRPCVAEPFSDPDHSAAEAIRAELGDH